MPLYELMQSLAYCDEVEKPWRLKDAMVTSFSLEIEAAKIMVTKMREKRELQGAIFAAGGDVGICFLFELDPICDFNVLRPNER